MIVKAAPTRRAGRGSFSALSEYLEIDDLGRKRADLLASWSGLVASHETAALEMGSGGTQLRACSRRAVAHNGGPGVSRDPVDTAGRSL